MKAIEIEDVDLMSDEQVRDMLKQLIEQLYLAQEDGVFGRDSWQGYLGIEAY